MENGVTSTKQEAVLSRMALNDNKAGMEGLDRDKINKIIMESSKGSRFYENELKKEQQVNQRIEKMMQQKAKVTEQHLKKAQVQVESLASALEKRRDLSRVIVHVDMDAFYAAVEMRDCPELKDKPMAVGSMSMLSTSNYHARKYGVRAAMPGFIAKKLCPNLVIVPTNFDKYRAVSSEIREIFADYDPHFQPMSLDEAYLDFTEHLEQRKSWPESLRTHHFRASSTTTGEDQTKLPQEPESKDLSPILFEDSPSSSPSLPGSGGLGPSKVFGTSAEEAVNEMRFRIEQKTKLTASAGIAPNAMLAKVCSDKNKPNGQYRLPSTREAVMDFIQNLPVRKVSGVGKVSEKMLKALGVSTCADLGQQMALLSLLFSETSWQHFLEVSLGLGSTSIARQEERKSMSTERTFKEVSRSEEQLSLCRELCADLAEDMKKEDLKGKTVTLKLKNVNFEVKTRAVTLVYPVSTADEIFAAAKELLKTEIENESPQPLRLRLMGVRISAFVDPEDKKPQQKSILGFLQTGKPDPGGPGPSQATHGKPEREAAPPSCPPAAQTAAVPPWRAKKWGLNGAQAGAGPQQSFFQRAQARRLQLQEGAARSGGHWDGKKGKAEPVPVEEDEKTEEEAGPNEDAPPSEEQASTSGIQWDCSGFTCPVCFKQCKIYSTDLMTKHIEECLAAQKDPTPCAVSDSDSDLESGQRGPTHEQQEEEKEEESEVQEKEEQLDAPQRREAKVLELICPVCQLSQDTDDLAVFNRHVDLCLNQEVLHELGTPAPAAAAPAASASNGKAMVSLPPSRQHNKGKSKRRDTPSSPPSKKAKGIAPRNTIDKFFR